MKRLITIAAYCFLSLILISCNGGGQGTPNPNAGFKIQTFAEYPNVVIPTAGNVNGQFLFPNGSTTGSSESFNHNHGGVGLLIVSGAKVPARWRLTLGPDFFGGSHCLTFRTVDWDVTLNATVPLYCQGRFFGFSASPDTINALNPVPTVTFTGDGIENTYGTPTLAFYDEYGSVVTSAVANQLLYNNLGEIEGVTISVPDISQLYDGMYTVFIHNINADTSWEVVGVAPVVIYGNPPPFFPPPDEGGCEPAPPDLPQLPCDPPLNH